MDFIEGLLLSASYNVILVIMDHLRKYVYFFMVKHPFSTLEIDQVFIRDFMRLYDIS